MLRARARGEREVEWVNLVFKSYLFGIIAHCTLIQMLLFVVFNFTMGPLTKDRCLLANKVSQSEIDFLCYGTKQTTIHI